MIGYVLLVVIAVGLSVAVYAYLKIYIPKTDLKCPEDVHLILKTYQCNIDSRGATLVLELQNKGFRSVNAAYIRMGNSSRQYRELLNSTVALGINLVPGNSTNMTHFTASPQFRKPGDYVLEIEPAIIKSKTETILCNEATITQTITCIEVT